MPQIPLDCIHNAHMFYLLLHDLHARTSFIEGMKQAGIGTVFHYIPLHSSPAGKRYGRSDADLPVTNAISDRLVRLPLWVGIEEHLDHVMDTASRILSRMQPSTQ